MRGKRLFILASTIALAASLSAQVAKKSPHPAFAEVADVAGLPRVLLIGDSISIGYTLPARRLLEGKVNLHRIPENGGPTIRALAKIESWLGSGSWDAIHFNWGLHDLRYMEDGRQQVPIDDYERNLRRLVTRLKKTGARLIWASTTPIPPDNVNPKPKNRDVIAYNAVALRIIEENDVQVNDLYSFALPRLAEMQRSRDVHFTEAGSAKLAERVAANILRVLGIEPREAERNTP